LAIKSGADAMTDEPRQTTPGPILSSISAQLFVANIENSCVVAAKFGGAEKQLCENPRHSLGPFQSHDELFDRNPIRLVRQSAKRRTTPNVFTSVEIKALISGLNLRERTLVLLAASTGLCQSELFGLKWGDIDFAQGTMNVTRSIVYGVVGRCGLRWMFILRRSPRQSTPHRQRSSHSSSLLKRTPP
jgi:integrase